MDESSKVSTSGDKIRQRGRVKLCLLCLCFCFVLCALFSSVEIYTLGNSILANASKNEKISNNQFVSNQNFKEKENIKPTSDDDAIELESNDKISNSDKIDSKKDVSNSFKSENRKSSDSGTSENKNDRNVYGNNAVGKGTLQDVTAQDIATDSANENALNVQRGSGAVVLEQSSCRVLFENNKSAKLYPASTTKVLTALVVLENLPLNKVVVIPKQAVGIEGSSIYLKEGESMSVKELLLGLMLRSGNDSAVALALSVSPSVEEFAVLMNKTALRVGATNSNFKNPHGLHDDAHYTTAYDLALITAEAFKNKDFREIVATKSAILSGKDEKRYIQNKNKMLWQYEGGNGVKTGYTKASGRCLVSSALRDGMQVICVVLNHGAMWEDSKTYMNHAFANYQMLSLYPKLCRTVEVNGGKTDVVKVMAEEPPKYPIKKDGSEKFEIDCSLQNLYAPVSSGEMCGVVKVTLSNHLIFEGKLYTIESVDKKTFRDKWDDFFRKK